jgi:2-polyprenyl-3-methyl-5-hydroxy-6-metoxy-1,4-benzoquinol methylase
MFTDHTENQKYIDYLQPLNQNVFDIIDSRIKQLDPSWHEKTILDYGCNNGHLLKTSRGKIRPEKYTGVDVQVKPLTIASQEFPSASWIHYNGHHISFAPNGDKLAKPEILVRPDIIVCHGVFTHCDFLTIENTIKYFKEIINPGGYIVFSIWEDFHLPLYVNIFLANRLKIFLDNEIINKPYSNSFYLINREYGILDKEELEFEYCEWIETFYRREYIYKKFPDAKFLEGTHCKHTPVIIPV